MKDFVLKVIKKILKISLVINLALTNSCFSQSQKLSNNQPSHEILVNISPETEVITPNPTPSDHSKVKSIYHILALGDSYTIGESVKVSDRWTSQLIQKLKSKKIDIDEKTIAMTGWTTDDLLKAIEKENIQKKYDFVYLLIGVNNQYQGLNIEDYRNEFRNLLNKAIIFSDNKATNVFVISIPDWGVTAYATNENREEIGKAIDKFNQVNKQEADLLKVNYIDINPISKKALNNSSYLADDELHPSAKMYKEWVDLIYDETVKKIK